MDEDTYEEKKMAEEAEEAEEEQRKDEEFGLSVASASVPEVGMLFHCKLPPMSARVHVRPRWS